MLPAGLCGCNEEAVIDHEPAGQHQENGCEEGPELPDAHDMCGHFLVVLVLLINHRHSAKRDPDVSKQRKSLSGDKN